MSSRVEEFTRKLADAYGANLVSVVLYGSAARGDYREGVSDLNLLVVLREAGPAALARGTTLAREWAAEGNPPPLTMGEVEWRASVDVFPIEYSDMRDAHRVLHGRDPFEGVEVGWTDLRLQAEHELKQKQIRLREHYLLSADRPAELGPLLVQSLPTFLTLFRTGLRLLGREAPREPERVLAAISAEVGFDPAPVQEVLRARREGGKFEPAGDGPVVTGYLDAVARTTRWLDRLAPPDAAEAPGG
jgi:predicted nucleotidyltransferase